MAVGLVQSRCRQRLAMGWPAWTKSSGGPSAAAPDMQGQKFENSFSISRITQNLQVVTVHELLVLCGRFVHVGETINRSADFGP